MYWRLSDTVTFCVASDRILFLDVQRDRYFALPPIHEEAFLAWLGPSGRVLPGPCRDLLRDCGLLDSDRSGEPVATPCQVVAPTTVDAEPLPPQPIRPAAMVGVGRAVLSAWHDVRSRPLGAILARRLSKNAFSEPAGTAREPKVAEFRTIRPLIPVPRVCLHDCLALLDWLGPERRQAQLVFGVSAYPFAAHCWVQVDGAVLDDHPDSPSRFQPILHFP